MDGGERDRAVVHGARQEGAPLARVRHGYVDVGDVRIHYAEQGAGPLILLLHGFPDFWYSWRFQMPVLAAAGFRAVAIDLRGYNRSSKPQAVRSYALECGIDDVAALIPALSARRAVIVGHDWGGLIGWRLGARRAELVERLIVLNSPHPRALRRTLLRSLQALRSWYVGFFQIPWLPEQLLGARDCELLVRALRRDTRRAAGFTEADEAAYRSAFSDRAALRAAVNYYRALFRPRARPGGGAPRTDRAHTGPRSRTARLHGLIGAPTLLLWGDQDPHLSSDLTRGLEQWAPGIEVERYGNAGHWVHWDAADAVNSRILEFVGTGANPRARSTAQQS